MIIIAILDDLRHKTFSINELVSYLDSKGIEVSNTHFLNEAECRVRKAAGNQWDVTLVKGQKRYSVTFDLLGTKLLDNEGYTKYYIVGHKRQRLRNPKHYQYSTIFDPDLTEDFVIDFLAEEIEFDWLSEGPHTITSDTVVYTIDKVIEWYEENFEEIEESNDWDKLKLNEWKEKGVDFLEFIL